MELDIRSNKIDPNSNFGRAFQINAEYFFVEKFGKGFLSSLSTQNLLDDVRQKIDEAMMVYLLTHDGVVDGWPDPDTGLTVQTSTGTAEQFRYTNFNYFSLGTLGQVVSKEATKYRNHYKYTNSKIYEETIANGEYTGVSLSKNRKEIIKYWVARLPLIFALMASVLLLLQLAGLDFMKFLYLIEGVNNKTVTIVAPGIDVALMYPLALLFGLPCAFAMFVNVLLIEKMGILGLPLGIIILLAIGYACYRWLIFKWDKPSPKKQRDIRRQIKEKKAIRNSEEYKRIVAEEEAMRKMCTELSEQWHRAWYECYSKSC